MAYIKRYRVSLAVTAVDGASQAFYTSDIFQAGGYVESVRYTRATASALATTARLLITAEVGGQTILDVSATGDVTHYPRVAMEGTTGNALGYTSAATPPLIPTRIPVGQERIKIEVTSGGAASAATDALRGTVDFYIAGV